MAAKEKNYCFCKAGRATYLVSSSQIHWMPKDTYSQIQHLRLIHLFSDLCVQLVFPVSYICLFGFDVVAGEDALAVPDGAVPPLAFLLADQDDVSFPEGQITRLRRLVGVQGHVLCRGKTSIKTLFPDRTNRKYLKWTLNNIFSTLLILKTSNIEERCIYLCSKDQQITIRMHFLRKVALNNF